MSCSLLNSFIREIKSHYDSRLQNQEGYRMVFVSICELARRAFRSNELKLRHLFFSHFKATKCLKEFKGKRMRLGSVLVGDSDFFFVPCSCHVDQLTFHIFVTEDKIHHLYLLIRLCYFIPV